MYICDKHGELSSEWCDECEEIKQCDCSDMTYTRIKDIHYDCNEGERNLTIRIHHCETCGEVSHIA